MIFLHSPIAVIVSISLPVGIFLYLVSSTRIEIWKLKRKLQSDYESIRRTCEDLGLQISSMRSDVDEANARAAVLVPPPSARFGINMNRRLQAVRMAKRGETTERIAAALGLPRNEVALLLKVQQRALGG